MKTTFDNLGIPFPLFLAPVECADGYHEDKYCTICKSNKKHCFKLGIGCALIIKCPACNAQNKLDADDRCDVDCRECKSVIPFPIFAQLLNIYSCYDCLRLGKAAITKDTEEGMVTWDQLVSEKSRMMHLPSASFITNEIILELVQTPTYISIQGDRWLFCCEYPMSYIGNWDSAEFTRRAPDGDGKMYFNSIVADAIPGLWENELHDVTGIYVFKCLKCQGIGILHKYI